MFTTPYSFNKPSCPINFEDRRYAGNRTTVEEFTGMNLSSVRSVILNCKVYFSAVDLCKGLCIGVDNCSLVVNNAINSIIEYENNKKVDPFLTERVPYNSSFDLNELAYIVTIPVVRKVNQYSDEVRTFYTPVLFVSEPVLYMLTFRSRKAEAEMFKAWLAMDVLPYLNILGRDKSLATIVNEVNMHVDQAAMRSEQMMNNVLANQNTMINGQTIMINDQRNNHDATNCNINDLRGRIDCIGNMSAKNNEDEKTINKKVDGIVNGLAALLNI